jgi:hypothetical protein
MTNSDLRPSAAPDCGTGRLVSRGRAGQAHLARDTPSERSGCDGKRAGHERYERDEIGEQIWRLVYSHSYRKRWLAPMVEDAVQEVEWLLQEWGLGPLRHKFSRRYFGDPDYLIVKKRVFQAIETALDRLRQRHKVEVKPGSVWFDQTRLDSGRRQRRDLPRNQHLGDHDRLVSDGTEQLAASADAALDLNTAMDALCPIGRQIVVRKVQLDQTWEAIAAEFDIPVSRAKHFYKTSIARLSKLLGSYRPSAARLLTPACQLALDQAHHAVDRVAAIEPPGALGHLSRQPGADVLVNQAANDRIQAKRQLLPQKIELCATDVRPGRKRVRRLRSAADERDNRQKGIDFVTGLRGIIAAPFALDPIARPG